MGSCMGVFLSTFCNKIDKKGRVSVPSSFRTALGEQSFQGIVVFPSLFLQAIEGMGMDRMERLSHHADTLDMSVEKERNVFNSVFADAQALSFDGEGRIVLSEALCHHAQLTHSVTFVGRGLTFQLWNPELFAAHHKKARALKLEKKNQITASEVS